MKDAIAFLMDRGVMVRHLPREMTPGLDYTVFAIDPQGTRRAALLLDGEHRLGRTLASGGDPWRAEMSPTT